MQRSGAALDTFIHRAPSTVWHERQVTSLAFATCAGCEKARSPAPRLAGGDQVTADWITPSWQLVHDAGAGKARDASAEVIPA
jgi:hypothetical protein